MQGCDCVRNEIHIDDIHTIFRSKRKHRQPGEKYKSSHHIELCGLTAAAVAKHDARTEKRLGHVRQKLPDHVLTELLGSSVWIIVGAVPVNRLVFADNFVL